MELLWPWVGSSSPSDFPNTEAVQSALCMVCLTVLKSLLIGRKLFLWTTQTSDFISALKWKNVYSDPLKCGVAFRCFGKISNVSKIRADTFLMSWCG